MFGDDAEDESPIGRHPIVHGRMVDSLLAISLVSEAQPENLLWRALVTPLRGTCSGAINGVMTPDEALTLYRPIRASIQRVLKVAVRVCSDVDVKRAAKQLGGWSRGRIEVPSETAVDMVSDLALFEPNQRGTRAYDRFLRDHAETLEPGDVDLAHQMAGARFSIFRVLGRHDLAGVWVEDVINGGEPIWVLDEGLEVSAPDGVEFAMRIFDAGDFYAGFGIVVPAHPEITDFCEQAVSRGQQADGSAFPRRGPLRRRDLGRGDAP